MGKVTAKHLALLEDENADPLDRGWAVHLVGFDGLKHYEGLISRFVEHPDPYLSGYALEALLRWGRVEYLDLTIQKATEEAIEGELDGRDILIKALGLYAARFDHRKSDALRALVAIVDAARDLAHVRWAYSWLHHVCEGRFIEVEGFSIEDVDEALLAPLRGPVKPVAH